MRVTFLGQAGLYLETRAGSILCDPWFNPAYFGSWFPFPANDGIDPRSIGSPDYLYVSHLHHDHFDPAWLSAHCSKDATVILPDYPVDDLRHELHELGFRRFVETADCEPFELDGGLRIMVMALDAPTDGPLGDSALLDRRRRGPAPEHERLAADRPRQAPRVRPARPALPPVLGRDLVPDGVRVPAEGEGHPRRTRSGSSSWPGPSATSRSSTRRSSSRAPGRRASSTTTCSSRTTSDRTPPTSSRTRRSSSTTSPR